MYNCIHSVRMLLAEVHMNNGEKLTISVKVASQ